MSGNSRGIKRKHVIYDGDLPSEEWKSIKDYDGYEISNLGRVKSLPKHLKNPIILHFAVDKDGYKRVFIEKNKKAKRWGIHQLVATFFIENIENKPCVNHKDGNKSNNKVENLEWATVAENNSHAWETGLKVGLPKFSQRKLNKETVDSIRSLAGTMPQKDIADKYNIGFRMVSKIINNTNIYVKW